MILHFAKTVPPKIPANFGIGISKQLGGASQAEVDCTYFDALQSLSSSPLILSDPSTVDSPNDSVEVQEVYSKILGDISLERVRGKSVQVNWPRGDRKISPRQAYSPEDTAGVSSGRYRQLHNLV